MFKFNEYPEIKKAFREFTRLKNRTYAAEKKIKPDDEASELAYDEAYANWDAFFPLFAQIIYNTFKDKKPKLYHQFKDYFIEWDKVFPDTFEKRDEGLENNLLGLVLEIGYGNYWLPDEYYDDKPVSGCLPPPPTHTKPWNF